MAIISKIKAGAKKVTSAAVGVAKKVGAFLTAPISTKGLVASAGMAFPVAKGTTLNKEPQLPQATGSSGGTTYYNNYVPPSSSQSAIQSGQMDSGNNFSGNTSYKSLMTPANSGNTPYTSLMTPANSVKTISSGKQPIGSTSISTSGGVGETSYSPSQKTISSLSMGVSGAGLSGDSGGAGVSSPVVTPSNPGSVSPQIDTTTLAGRTAALYERQADGTLKEVKEDERSIIERKAKEQADLFKNIVGEMPGVEDDREVRQAREDRRQIQETLRGPTNELNAVISQQNVDILRMNEEGSSRGVTLDVFDRQKAMINYNAAIRALPLQASIASLQGDLELASDYLTELRQTKSDQIKRQYDYRKSLFESIQGVVKTEDQRAYEGKKTENELAYKEEQKLVDFQSELSMMVMQNAPESVRANVISRINNSGSIQDAITAAGKYGTDMLGQENKQLANQTGGNSDDLTAYASQYADTGKLPSPSELKLSGLSVGQVTNMAKQLPRPSGSLVSNKTGGKTAALSSAQEDGILALYDISQKTAELKTLEEKRVKGLSSALLGKTFGATDQENYLNLRTEIIDLLARARTGAALTNAEEAFYKAQLPGRIGQVGFGLFGANTQNKINNFETKINGTLNTKLNGQDLSIYGYSKVKLGGEERVVGEILDIGGVKYRVLPDGTLTDII